MYMYITRLSADNLEGIQLYKMFKDIYFPRF